MKYRYVVCFLYTMLCLAMGSSAMAASPELDFIAQSLRNQEQACGESLQVTYTVSGTSLAGTPGATKTVRYTRTPGILFFEETSEDEPGVVGRASYNRATGELMEAGIRDDSVIRGFILEGRVPPRLTLLENMETSVLYTMIAPLYQAIGYGTIADAPELIDGHSCWRITVPVQKMGFSDKGEYIVWLDPDIGFCPRRLDRTLNGSNTEPGAFSISFRDYRELGNGVYFPTSQVIARRPTRPGTTSTLVEASIGLDIELSDITIAFPPGIPVTDELSGETIVMP